MGKIAFVFSGQGDQFVGMGKDLYEKYEIARSVFDMCESMRCGTLAQCFSGSEEQLKETANTQPCLFAMELAAANVLKANGIIPHSVAGFSLGEVTACTFSEIFDNQTGFKLVCRRGQLMQEAANQNEAAMAAVLKLDNDQVKELCAKYSHVYPVNFNCPGQVTVSGLADEMTTFYADVKAAGGRALPLKVKGAFHSPFMNEAAASFEKELSSVNVSKPCFKLYSNMTASIYTEAVSELLSKQICSPVLWENIVRNMIADGIDTFIEIGPGKTLINIIKKIDQSVSLYSTSDIDTIFAEVERC